MTAHALSAITWESLLPLLDRVADDPHVRIELTFGGVLFRLLPEQLPDRFTRKKRLAALVLAVANASARHEATFTLTTRAGASSSLLTVGHVLTAMMPVALLGLHSAAPSLTIDARAFDLTKVAGVNGARRIKL